MSSDAMYNVNDLDLLLCVMSVPYVKSCILYSKYSWSQVGCRLQMAVPVVIVYVIITYLPRRFNQQTLRNKHQKWSGDPEI